MKSHLVLVLAGSLLTAGCSTASKTVTHACKLSEDEAGSGFKTTTTITLTGQKSTDSIDQAGLSIIMDNSDGAIDDTTKSLLNMIYNNLDNVEGITCTYNDTGTEYTVEINADLATAKDGLEQIGLSELTGVKMSEAIEKIEDEGYSCN